MRDILIGSGALAIYIQCWRKFGFDTATRWAKAIILLMLLSSIVGLVAGSIIQKLWNEQAPSTQIGVAVAAIVALIIATKQRGIGGALKFLFITVFILSAITMLGIMCIAYCSAIHVPPLVLAVFSLIIWVLAKGYRRR